MHILHLANGFTFIAVVTGVACFFSTIGVAAAIDDGEAYTRSLVIVTIILGILFLTCGFLGFATQ